MSSKNIVIAFGGSSPEHEVSVLSAMQVFAALKESSYTLIPLYITKSGKWYTGEKLSDLSVYKDIAKIEQAGVPCAFMKDDLGTTHLKQQSNPGLFSKPLSSPVYAVICAFHGSEGENGSFQGVCETFNVPYSGSGVLASSVGMDKVKAKQLSIANEIPVTKYIDFYESDWVKDQKSIQDKASKLGFPLVVKPTNLGSSIGVKKVENANELEEAVEIAFRYDHHILVEEAIQPLIEINCSVLGTAEECRPSVCEKPIGSSLTLSFEDKYQSGGNAEKGMASADRIIPADISHELTSQIQELATKTFKAFDASGVARLDFLVKSDTQTVYFNEINTIPGSFSFYLWEQTNISFSNLVEELISIALKKHQAKNGRVRSYDTNLLSEKAAKGLKGLKGVK